MLFKNLLFSFVSAYSFVSNASIFFITLRCLQLILLGYSYKYADVKIILLYKHIIKVIEYILILTDELLISFLN